MNKSEYDILRVVYNAPSATQREISEQSNCSLGYVCKALKRLESDGYIRGRCVTDKGVAEVKLCSPRKAVILAAGFGMRMAPINTEVAKGMLEVNGEALVERLIKQLHEVGIFEIYIVVGFLKEGYEYLIDKYSVKLIVNNKYATTNNLHSLNCAIDYIDNAYIIPCDLWFKTNPFNRHEFYSWYMVSDERDIASDISVNRKGELVKVGHMQYGNKMVGVSYITYEVAVKLRARIKDMCANRLYDKSFWEEALYANKKMTVYARCVSSDNVVEINTFEQLRELDGQSKNLKTDAMYVIAQVFGVGMDEIKNITILKKGMTNRSFLFDCNDKKYIMRIPGEGTSELINRQQEYAVYQVLKGKNICDNILYLNPDNGYKITEFWQGARVCDPTDTVDVGKCMKKLREFHELGLKVDHDFDLYEQIEKYEVLRGQRSAYVDYEQTKNKVMRLKPFIRQNIESKVLTHIDAVPDNFLFIGVDGKEEVKLIDWEYAGMQDPHVDVAMFCIYAMYDRENIDKVIDLYFDNACPPNMRTKIYCYVAVCGLLWSNWCEYKRSLGVDFGEYSLAQYRFAKVYSDIVLRLSEGGANE